MHHPTINVPKWASYEHNSWPKNTLSIDGAGLTHSLTQVQFERQLSLKQTVTVTAPVGTGPIKTRRQGRRRRNWLSLLFQSAVSWIPLWPWVNGGQYVGGETPATLPMNAIQKQSLLPIF